MFTRIDSLHYQIQRMVSKVSFPQKAAPWKCLCLMESFLGLLTTSFFFPNYCIIFHKPEAGAVRGNGLNGHVLKYVQASVMLT